MNLVSHISSRVENRLRRFSQRYKMRVSRYEMRRGMTATETLVYLALLVVLSLAVAQALFGIVRAAYHMRMSESVSGSAAVVIERLTREVRQATFLDDASSTYGTSPGVLMLATATSSATTTVQFLVSGGRLSIRENGGSAQPLTSAYVIIDSLIFRKASASSSRAVRIELSLHDSRAATTTPETFYATALLRGTY